jgi:VWFA-related protein
MRHLRALLCAAVLLVGTFFPESTAQGQQGPSDTPDFLSNLVALPDFMRLSLLKAAQAGVGEGSTTGNPGTPTIQVTSRLVFLDVTVLDKKGRPVVKGLGRDDFTITEDKRPQSIFSFEAPQTHTISALARDDNPDGKAPLTIFVLDMLNSSFEDFAFIRYSVQKYLAAQPPLLSSPAEMMVIGNKSLELMQGPTRNREDLLYALDHLPPAIPYKWEADSFNDERFNQSLDALQQIALQNKGVPGRKNIVWVGHGSPSFNTRGLTEPVVNSLQQYMHATTNMLVDARVSLFVIYPGLKIGHFVLLSGRSPLPISAADAQANIDNDHPFAEDINFGVFVNETGGQLFFNRNDVDAEIGRSQQLGSDYYTLTYQPRGGDANGEFRQIRVTLRDHYLRAVTKTGYYAPDKSAPIDPRSQTKLDLAEAARSSVPFAALDLKVAGIVRHPENHTAEITLLLQSKGIDWQAIDDGKSSAEITLAAVSITGGQEVLASKVERLILSVHTQDPSHLARLVTHLQLTIRVEPKTQSVRVVAETANGGPTGAADLDRQAIEAAPATPAPLPQLLCRQPCPVKPPLPPSQ